MNKERLIEYLEKLEWEARQSDKFFIERNELHIENQKLKKERQELRSWLKEETKKGGSSIDLAIRIHTIQEVLNKLNELEGGKK